MPWRFVIVLRLKWCTSSYCFSTTPLLRISRVTRRPSTKRWNSSTSNWKIPTRNDRLGWKRATEQRLLLLTDIYIYILIFVGHLYINDTEVDWQSICKCISCVTKLVNSGRFCLRCFPLKFVAISLAKPACLQPMLPSSLSRCFDVLLCVEFMMMHLLA